MDGDSGELPKCEVCGKAAKIHLTEINNGVKSDHSYCAAHAPVELRGSLPFGPHRTSAEEAEFLRRQLEQIEKQITDPEQLAAVKAEYERIIAQLEAGGRLEDLM